MYCCFFTKCSFSKGTKGHWKRLYKEFFMTNNRADFLPPESKYHMTSVRHYLLPNLLPLKVYGSWVCHRHTNSFLTWSIFEADKPNLSNPLPDSLQFLILCRKISIKVTKPIDVRPVPGHMRFGSACPGCSNGTNRLCFAGFNRWWRVDWWKRNKDLWASETNILEARERHDIKKKYWHLEDFR